MDFGPSGAALATGIPIDVAPGTVRQPDSQPDSPDTPDTLNGSGLDPDDPSRTNGIDVGTGDDDGGHDLRAAGLAPTHKAAPQDAATVGAVGAEPVAEWWVCVSPDGVEVKAAPSEAIASAGNTGLQLPRPRARDWIWGESAFVAGTEYVKLAGGRGYCPTVTYTDGEPRTVFVRVATLHGNVEPAHLTKEERKLLRQREKDAAGPPPSALPSSLPDPARSPLPHGVTAADDDLEAAIKASLASFEAEQRTVRLRGLMGTVAVVAAQGDDASSGAAVETTADGDATAEGDDGEDGDAASDRLRDSRGLSGLSAIELCQRDSTKLLMLLGGDDGELGAVDMVDVNIGRPYRHAWSHPLTASSDAPGHRENCGLCAQKFANRAACGEFWCAHCRICCRCCAHRACTDDHAADLAIYSPLTGLISGRGAADLTASVERNANGECAVAPEETDAWVRARVLQTTFAAVDDHPSRRLASLMPETVLVELEDEVQLPDWFPKEWHRWATRNPQHSVGDRVRNPIRLTLRHRLADHIAFAGTKAHSMGQSPLAVRVQTGLYVELPPAPHATGLCVAISDSDPLISSSVSLQRCLPFGQHNEQWVEGRPVDVDTTGVLKLSIPLTPVPEKPSDQHLEADSIVITDLNPDALDLDVDLSSRNVSRRARRLSRAFQKKLAALCQGILDSNTMPKMPGSRSTSVQAVSRSASVQVFGCDSRCPFALVKLELSSNERRALLAAARFHPAKALFRGLQGLANLGVPGSPVGTPGSAPFAVAWGGDCRLVRIPCITPDGDVGCSEVHVADLYADPDGTRAYQPGLNSSDLLPLTLELQRAHPGSKDVYVGLDAPRSAVALIDIDCTPSKIRQLECTRMVTQDPDALVGWSVLDRYMRRSLCVAYVKATGEFVLHRSGSEHAHIARLLGRNDDDAPYTLSRHCHERNVGALASIAARSAVFAECQVCFDPKPATSFVPFCHEEFRIDGDGVRINGPRHPFTICAECLASHCCSGLNQGQLFVRCPAVKCNRKLRTMEIGKIVRPLTYHALIADLKQAELARAATDCDPIPGGLDIRLCPECHVRIEKNAGCNNMNCFRCGTNFSWTDAKVARPAQRPAPAAVNPFSSLESPGTSVGGASAAATDPHVTSTSGLQTFGAARAAAVVLWATSGLDRAADTCRRVKLCATRSPCLFMLAIGMITFYSTKDAAPHYTLYDAFSDWPAYFSRIGTPKERALLTQAAATTTGDSMLQATGKKEELVGLALSSSSITTADLHTVAALSIKRLAVNTSADSTLRQSADTFLAPSSSGRGNPSHFTSDVPCDEPTTIRGVIRDARSDTVAYVAARSDTLVGGNGEAFAMDRDGRNDLTASNLQLQQQLQLHSSGAGLHRTMGTKRPCGLIGSITSLIAIWGIWGRRLVVMVSLTTIILQIILQISLSDCLDNGTTSAPLQNATTVGVWQQVHLITLRDYGVNTLWFGREVFRAVWGPVTLVLSPIFGWGMIVGSVVYLAMAHGNRHAFIDDADLSARIDMVGAGHIAVPILFYKLGAVFGPSCVDAVLHAAGVAAETLCAFALPLVTEVFWPVATFAFHEILLPLLSVDTVFSGISIFWFGGVAFSFCSSVARLARTMDFDVFELADSDASEPELEADSLRFPRSTFRVWRRAARIAAVLVATVVGLVGAECSWMFTFLAFVPGFDLDNNDALITDWCAPIANRWIELVTSPFMSSPGVELIVNALYLNAVGRTRHNAGTFTTVNLVGVDFNRFFGIPVAQIKLGVPTWSELTTVCRQVAATYCTAAVLSIPFVVISPAVQHYAVHLYLGTGPIFGLASPFAWSLARAVMLDGAVAICLYGSVTFLHDLFAHDDFADIEYGLDIFYDSFELAEVLHCRLLNRQHMARTIKSLVCRFFGDALGSRTCNRFFYYGLCSSAVMVGTVASCLIQSTLVW